MSRFNSPFVPARTITRLPFLGLSWESESALTFKNWDEFNELCDLLETLASVAYYPNRELTQRRSSKKLRQSLGALRTALMGFKSKRVSKEAWNTVLELKKCVRRLGQQCTLEPSEDPEEKQVWCDSWTSIAYVLSVIAAGSFDAAYFRASVEIHMARVNEVLDNLKEVSQRGDDDDEHAKENFTKTDSSDSPPADTLLQSRSRSRSSGIQPKPRVRRLPSVLETPEGQW